MKTRFHRIVVAISRPGRWWATSAERRAPNKQAKCRLERVDFADLLEIAASLLTTDVDVSQAVRCRWAHVTVDEYQDTDPAQQRLLDAILGDGQELCVVGHPRQAIYSWKGADPTYLTRFTERYLAARVFDLTRNYRSSPQILTWANCLAREGGTKPLTATRPAGPVPQAHRLDTEADEAGWIAGAIRKVIAAGTPPSEIAVLYRFNAAQARFEATLTQADIAIVVAEDVTIFERDEIRSVLVAFGQAAQASRNARGLNCSPKHWRAPASTHSPRPRIRDNPHPLGIPTGPP